MPFFKRKDSKEEASTSSSSHGASNGGGSSNGASNKEKVNYKARLEHKQYLATESPEPVYDISECGLKNVPSGVYSRCMIQRKEALLLQDNELVNLSGGGCLTDLSKCLQVLDLHNNHLEKLPDEIGLLKALRVLYVHHNKLKKVPDSISNLARLQSLDLSHNGLKELPSSVSKLTRLKTLDLSHNPKLKKLPKQLAHCHSLDKLVGPDLEVVQYPPASICKESTEAVMRFLAKECDIEYVCPSAYVPPDDGLGTVKNGLRDQEDPYEKIVRGSLKLLDKQKEAKMQGMKAMERERETREKEEAALASNVKESKKRLLNDLAKEEAQREDAVKKLQQLKDKEKQLLVTSLSNVENRTDALINELMKSQKAEKDPQKVLEEMERERKEMEELFTIKADEVDKLREQDVLKAMQSVMEEEMKREMMRRQYEQGKQDVIKNSLCQDLEASNAVENVLAAKGKQQQQLIGNLLEDEKYQRNAFAALFMQQDTRHKEICSQVEQIQSELASLTMVEMTKKDLKVEFENDVMKEKRETLTQMLMTLMEQKDERKNVLNERLSELEKNKAQETENYWLIQYQKLLDSKPQGLLEAEKQIDAGLREMLTKAGAEEYIPVFAKKGVTMKQVAYMKEKELSELGVHNEYLRQKIMVCSEEYAAMQERLALKLSGGDTKTGGVPTAPPAEMPSAPPMGASEPSAPPPAQLVDTYQSNECVVCMENKCDIIFLPCGHVCSCWKCEAGLSECPLCRAPITQKVRLN